MDTVETFKYKTYGQNEIADELDKIEIEKAFPSYTNHFDDLMPTNVLEATKPSVQQSFEANENEAEQAIADEQKYVLNTQILPQTFDMIELILNEYSSSTNRVIK